MPHGCTDDWMAAGGGERWTAGSVAGGGGDRTKQRSQSGRTETPTATALHKRTGQETHTRLHYHVTGPHSGPPVTDTWRAPVSFCLTASVSPFHSTATSAGSVKSVAREETRRLPPSLPPDLGASSPCRFPFPTRRRRRRRPAARRSKPYPPSRAGCPVRRRDPGGDLGRGAGHGELRTRLPRPLLRRRGLRWVRSRRGHLLRSYLPLPERRRPPPLRPAPAGDASAVVFFFYHFGDNSGVGVKLRGSSVR